MRRVISVGLSLALGCCAAAQDKDVTYYMGKVPFSMQTPALPQIPGHTVLITDYGAVGNGAALNTGAFARAIAACEAAGGGSVIVPPGLWLTGPIELKSHINLVVERGAVIQFTRDHTQYPIIPAGPGSESYTPASPLYGYGLTDVALSGGGVLDGGGDSWRPVKKGKVTEDQWKAFLAEPGSAVSNDGTVWWPSTAAMKGESYLASLRKAKRRLSTEDVMAARDYLRPYMVYLVGCHRVLLEGVTLRNSPKFVLYPNNCTDLTIRYCNIFNEYWAQNGDGIDVSVCKDVLLFHCNVSAGDDGICMKSGGDEATDPDSARLERIVIAACTVYHAHGGFVIGSETSGGIRKIFVTDCSYIGTDAGIRVKSNAGRGGYVREIYIDGIAMTDIVREAVLFTPFYEDVPAGADPNKRTAAVPGKTPIFTDFHISHVFCKGAARAIAITGLPDSPVHDIFFSDVWISASEGIITRNARDIYLDHVHISTPEGVQPLQPQYKGDLHIRD